VIWISGFSFIKQEKVMLSIYTQQVKIESG